MSVNDIHRMLTRRMKLPIDKDYEELDLLSRQDLSLPSRGMTRQGETYRKIEHAANTMVNIINSIVEDDVWNNSNDLVLKKVCPCSVRREALQTEIYDAKEVGELTKLVTEWALTRIKVILVTEERSHAPFWRLRLSFEVHSVSNTHLAQGVVTNGISHLDADDISPYHYFGIRTVLLSSFVNSIKLD
jgi:hypothetical protein